MLSRHNGGVQLLMSSLNSCLLGCFGPHTSLLLLLPVTSLVNPCLYPLGGCCLLSVALQSSHCHLVSTSLPAVGTAPLPAVGTALSSRILGFRSWPFFFVLHVRLIRVLLLASWLTDALSPFLPSPAAIGLLFLAPSTRCRLLLLC